MSIQRGATYTLPFGSLTTAGAANTTTVPTCVISKDAGAQAAATNAPTHNGNGEWKIVLTATEMTAGTVSGVAYGAGLVPSFFRIITEADYTPAKAAFLDAAVSSRSTYAGGDTQGTGTLLLRLPGTVQPQTGDAYARIGLNGAALTAIGDTRMGNLDAAVSSRLAATAYTAPTAAPTVVQIRTELDANSTKLANLDAAVSSRSTYAGGAVASVTAAVTVGSNQDKAGYSLATAPPTVVAIRQEIDANSTKLDVAVSSRLAGAAYTSPTTAPTVAQIAAGILINPAYKLATDASGYVTYNNAASGGGSATDWTDADRQQIRWILGIDGTKTAPTNSTARLSDIQTVSTTVTTNGANINATLSAVNTNTGTLSSIQLQTNKMSFDGQSYLYVNVANYQTLKSPGEQVLMYPSLKIATDSSGNVQTASAGGGTTAPTVVQIRTEMDANSTKLANLDTNVGSRLAGAAYTAPTSPPTVIQIRTEMDANSAKMANLDAPVTSRLAGTAYAAPPTVAQIAAGILINPTYKLATDASGFVTYNNAASGGGSATDWTDAERQQIRFVLGIDGVRTQPTTGAGSIQGIAAQTGKLGFDGSNNVRAVTAGLTSTATVSGYSAGMGPHELVLKIPANKLATDALGNVVVPNVTLAPGGLDLIAFDGLTAKSALQGMSAVAMGEIVYDAGTQTGTVSSATNPNVVKIRFSSDPNFTSRTNVALTLNS